MSRKQRIDEMIKWGWWGGRVAIW